MTCTECKPGYYGFPDCKDCKCDPVASLGITCGKDNGKCDCKPTATGDKCEFCKPGYWKHPECIDCDCDIEGSEDNNCDKDNGVCICKKRKDGKVVIEGDKCDKCRVFFIVLALIIIIIIIITFVFCLKVGMAISTSPNVKIVTVTYSEWWMYHATKLENVSVSPITLDSNVMNVSQDITILRTNATV